MSAWHCNESKLKKSSLRSYANDESLKKTTYEFGCRFPKIPTSLPKPPLTLFVRTSHASYSNKPLKITISLLPFFNLIIAEWSKTWMVYCGYFSQVKKNDKLMKLDKDLIDLKFCLTNKM